MFFDCLANQGCVVLGVILATPEVRPYLLICQIVFKAKHKQAKLVACQVLTCIFFDLLRRDVWLGFFGVLFVLCVIIRFQECKEDLLNIHRAERLPRLIFCDFGVYRVE